MDGKRIKPFPSTRDPRPPGTLDPETTALVVVDMQYFDAHRDWGYGHTARRLGVEGAMEEYFSAIDEITPRIRRILDAARGLGLECVHLRVAEVATDSRDVGYKQLVRGLVVPPDSKEAQFLEDIAPVPGEIVVSKSSSGVFPVTNFDRLLRNMGIETLVFTGTVTGGCIESAVHDAVDLGYRILLVDDACADTTADAHDMALARMEGGSVSVTSTGAFLEALGRAEPVDRRAKSGLVRVREYLPDSSTVPADSPNPTDHIFPPPIRVEPDPTDTILLLVDFQRLFCDPSAGLGRTLDTPGAEEGARHYYEEVELAVEAASGLLDRCREAGITPVHVRTVAPAPGGRGLSPGLVAAGIGADPGSEEAEFVAPLEPAEGEIVLDKFGRGAFYGTGLDELLRNLGVGTVILAVVSADGGLEATLRSATDRGYRALVAADACALTHPGLRRRLLGMDSGIINVRTCDEISRALG